MKSIKIANSNQLRSNTTDRKPRRHYFNLVLPAILMNISCAIAQDFEIKFPADLSNHDGSNASGAAANPDTRGHVALPNELLTPLDPTSYPVKDPLMQEGSPIPDVLAPATSEKKTTTASAVAASTLASARELFDAAKKFEVNQEFGKALTSYEDAIKLFRSSKKNSGASLQTEVALRYAALLKKLNNSRKAVFIEKEFGVSLP